ncbi:MAG: hypothetical protein JNM86_06705 [Phycisphaerae bacterium]|nr:hypothetical protein [Phycisphaerae bacterium]
MSEAIHSLRGAGKKSRERRSTSRTGIRCHQSAATHATLQEKEENDERDGHAEQPQEDCGASLSWSARVQVQLLRGESARLFASNPLNFVRMLDS